MKNVQGDAMAELATWNFLVNSESDKIYTIDLGSQTLNGKIYPGTKGSFDIIIDASDTEIGVEYVINFINETNKPQNLKFIYEEKIYNSIIELDGIMSNSINENSDNLVITETIQWEWPYETGSSKKEIEENDLQDTLDMRNISQYTFQIIVSGTQMI